MNDKSKELYRHSSREAQETAKRFESIEDPTSSRAEIAAARTLIQQCLNQNPPNVSLVNSLLATIDRLQKSEFRRMLVQHELITRPSIMRWARELVSIVAEEISVLSGWEDVLASLSDRLAEDGSLWSSLRNEPEDVANIQLPR